MDLKPTNMLVNGPKEKVVVKLSDFGEVALFQSTITNVSTSVSPLKGTTLGYVAPEILNGAVDKNSTFTDIYSLGMSMFEILSNKENPWEDFSLPAIILKDRISSGTRPNAQCLAELYNADISSIVNMIKKCWDQDSYRRPTTAEVINSLEHKDEMQLPRKRIRKHDKYHFENIARYYLNKDIDPDHIEKVFIHEIIGFGVFAKRDIEKSDFIAAYIGETVSAAEGEKRLQGDQLGEERSYLYFFSHEKRKLCIDASNSKERLGFFINDSKNRNCFTKVICTESGMPFVCFFASKDIPKDTELRYDYTDKNLKWRKDKNCKSFKDPLTMSDVKAFQQLRKKREMIEGDSSFQNSNSLHPLKIDQRNEIAVPEEEEEEEEDRKEEKETFSYRQPLAVHVTK